jgi:hypothetical protein
MEGRRKREMVKGRGEGTEGQSRLMEGWKRRYRQTEIERWRDGGRDGRKEGSVGSTLLELE